MAKRRFLYHGHMVDALRRRIGRVEADVLLRDAARNSDAQREALGRALDAEMSQAKSPECESDVIVYGVIQEEHHAWVGNELQLWRHLPDTLQVAIVGRRLGDVVTGSGADDHRITGVTDWPIGTRITISTDLVEGRRIAIPITSWLSGPLRRFRRWLPYTWHRDFIDKTRQVPPGIGTLAIDAGLGLFGLLIGVMSLALGFGRYGQLGWLFVVMPGPLVAWLVTGCLGSLHANTRIWLANRHKAL